MKQFQRILVCAIMPLFVTACGDAVDRTEPPPSTPSAPQNVQAMPADTQVTVSWNPVSGATSYNIYWNNTGAVTTANNQFIGVTSPYKHTGLINDATYYYIVTAVNAVGKKSVPSDEVSAIPAEYMVYFVSSADTADDSFDGLSADTAKQTITAAIKAAAVATLPAIVQVNAGTYNVNSDTSGTPTHVVLTDGVSLYGGYSADFIDRDPAANITTITDNSTLATGDSTLPNSALEAGAGISVATIVDGFIINGSTQAGADYTAAVWAHAGGAPTVRNNTLNSGSGYYSFGMYNLDSSPTVKDNTINGCSGCTPAIHPWEIYYYSYGMYNLTSSPTVQNNTLNGGSGNYSYGMYNYSSSSPTVQNNTINGGIGNSSIGMVNFSSSSPTVQNNTINGDTGMLNSSSSPTVQNNTINGGSGGGTSYGMYNSSSSSPTVQNNTINGGSGSITSIGMRNNSSSPTVQNNTLNGGSGGTTSFGMLNDVSASPTVQNNTINGGSGGTTSYGIRNNYSSYPMIDNNIIFTRGVGAAYCIYELYPNSDPTSLRNNDLFSCSTALYVDYVDGSGCGSEDFCITDIADVNALADTTASGNVSLDPQFLNIDNDWHFSDLSPGSVTTGGLNGEDDGGWGFTTDKDGVPRPNTGLWSMGAYEP